MSDDNITEREILSDLPYGSTMYVCSHIQDPHVRSTYSFIGSTGWAGVWDGICPGYTKT